MYASPMVRSRSQPNMSTMRSNAEKMSFNSATTALGSEEIAILVKPTKSSITIDAD